MTTETRTAEQLAKEYRATMPTDILRLWAPEAATALASSQARIQELDEALNGLLAVAEMTTFSDQFPAECEIARRALHKDSK